MAQQPASPGTGKTGNGFPASAASAVSAEQNGKAKQPIPVTCFTGFLGAGKTSTILGLLTQLPKDYRVVLLKNEYGDVEVDSLLAKQGAIAGVSEIMNGCLCCTLVGQIQTAMIEIRDTMNPDRIIIESSGSAFPATLAIKVRELAHEGFSLDSVVTVIDCVNFRGYEDTSPTAKIQAKYTDALLLNKHNLITDRDLDTVIDHLYELNDETPLIRVSPEQPLKPELVFGLDTKLFERGSEELGDWEKLGAASGAGLGGQGQAHMDEVETRSVWRGGGRPGKGKKRDGHVHEHGEGERCDCGGEENGAEKVGVNGAESTEGIREAEVVDYAKVEEVLKKLPFEIYRVKGFLRLPSTSNPSQSQIHILNWAFSRSELTPMPSLDDNDELKGVTVRLTVMGARGEVAKRARKLAEVVEGEFA